MSGYNYRRLARANRGKPAYVRMMEKISPEPNTGCWLWTGCYDKDGYGFLRVDGKNIKVHRFSLEYHRGGRLEAGQLACHTCDMPACANPDHLYAGNNSDNQKDAAARGRSHGWSRVPRCQAPAAKLKAADVVSIRARSSEKAADLAKEYGVKPHAIRKIWARRTWGHVQ